MAMENFSFCFRELGIKEKLSIEKGENNWREVTKGAHLIRCASPIRGTAYEVIRRKNNVSEMFSAMLTLVPESPMVLSGAQRMYQYINVLLPHLSSVARRGRHSSD